MDKEAGWHGQFRAMCEAYRQVIPERIEELHQIWRSLQGEAWKPEAVQELMVRLHNLTGSGATFGFGSLSRASQRMESLLTELSSDHAPPSPEHLLKLAHALDTIRQIGMHLPESTLARVPPLAPSPQENLRTEPGIEESGASREMNPVLFIVETDTDRAESLAQQLTSLGYRPQVFDSLAQLTPSAPTDDATASPELEPAALIIDTVLLEGLDGERICKEYRGLRHPPPHLLFISDTSDIRTRLNSVRQGGEAFLTRPIQLSHLTSKLDALLNSTLPDPFRVVVVEDDPVMAEYFTSILQRHGIRTEVPSDPFQLPQVLGEFRPDLILMDRFLGDHCDGLDLAEAIRQDDGFVSVPIVFISTERDEMRRLDAIEQAGGDDFLTKPVAPRLLIQTVMTRARRHRALSALMLRDGLTGLLPHTRFHEHLQRELARTQRSGASLSLAILDIDHFKLVNDNHGHAIGDQVLRSLSRLLVKRLRRTDVIGRLGGEEFAVIFPETSAENARTVLDGLRADFSKLPQQSEYGDFHVSFSAGVASSFLSPYPSTLMDLADRALYTAKARGRNQIVLATPRRDSSLEVASADEKPSQ